MSLLDALNSYDAEVRLAMARPASKTLERAVNRISHLAEGVNAATLAPPQYIIDESISALRQSHRLTNRQAKMICIAGLDQINLQSDSQVLLERLIHFIRNNITQGVLKGLLIGYLRHSDGSSNFFSGAARNILSNHQESLPRVWRNRVQKFDLLKPEAAKKMASLVLSDHSMSSVEHLNSAGIKGILSQGAFAKSVFKSVCEQMSQGHNEDSLARFKEFTNRDDGVLFGTDLVSYSKAMLQPYRENNPDAEVQRELMDFLIKQFGDPRIKADSWTRASENDTAVLRRWLTEQSFEILLQVVRETNDTSMWRDRYAFWRPYIDQGLVTEAWVALGPDAENVARGMVRQKLIPSAQSYGSIRRGYIQSHHSMIIIRMGDFIITEWTHDGKFRLYGAYDKQTPALYKNSYGASHLRNDVWPLVAKSHQGNWQKSFAEILEKYTGENPHKKKSAPKKPSPSKNEQIRECSKCKKKMPAKELNYFMECPSCSGTQVKRR
jgi:hypothetical protein